MAESGRTLLETISVLALIGLVTVACIKIYHGAVNKTKATNTAKMIQTMVLERQHAPGDLSTPLKRKGPHGDLTIADDEDLSHHFWIAATIEDKGFCDALKKSKLIQAEFIKVDGTIDGSCPGELKFYFKRNMHSDVQGTYVDGEGQTHQCPAHATCTSNGWSCQEGWEESGNECVAASCEDYSFSSCPAGAVCSHCLSGTTMKYQVDSCFGAYQQQEDACVCPEHGICSGETLACEDGYFVSGEACASCGEHVVTCSDANTPTSCEEGYLPYAGECISTTCTTDEQCHTPCATCQDGVCVGECEIPEADLDAEEGKKCGTNQCMVYDSASQTCQYKCQRVEYLESTGTQYIDTGIYGALSLKGEIGVMPIARGYPLGSGKEANTAYWGACFTSKLQPYLGTGNQRIVLDYTLGTKYDLIINDDKKFYSNGEMYFDYGTTKNTYGFTGTKTITLFAFQYTSLLKSKMRLYYCRLIDNGTPVRDFIPVLDPQGTPAMFDKVSGTLFYNAGTGTFDYGPK